MVERCAACGRPGDFTGDVMRVPDYFPTTRRLMYCRNSSCQVIIFYGLVDRAMVETDAVVSFEGLR